MKRSRVNREILVAGVCLMSLACSVQAAVPEGLVAYYKLDATSGLTAVDETGAHDGTLTGALTWVPGKDGNALQFIGGNGSPFVNLGACKQTGQPAWAWPSGPGGMALAASIKG